MTEPTTETASGAFVYDPRRPDFAGRAYDVYGELRDRHPVYHNADRRFWALSRYEDVRAAASDTTTFSSEGTSISQGLRILFIHCRPTQTKMFTYS